MTASTRMVHSGGTLTGERRERIQQWLRANGIDPSPVSTTAPVFVLAVPDLGSFYPDTGPWLIQVIVFTQFHVNPNGSKEINYLTRDPVRYQRTVPLRVPFPTDDATGGEAHGQEQKVETVEEGERPPEHQGRPEADEREELRTAEGQEVQTGRSSSCSERVGEGGATRHGAAEEGSPRSSGPQVSLPEEDRKEEIAP